MLLYCLKCRKKQTVKILGQQRRRKTIILLKSAVCYCKRSGFIKKLQANGLLSILELKTPLSKIPQLGVIFL